MSSSSRRVLIAGRVATRFRPKGTALRLLLGLVLSVALASLAFTNGVERVTVLAGGRVLAEPDNVASQPGREFGSPNDVGVELSAAAVAANPVEQSIPEALARTALEPSQPVALPAQPSIVDNSRTPSTLPAGPPPPAASVAPTVPAATTPLTPPTTGSPTPPATDAPTPPAATAATAASTTTTTTTPPAPVGGGPVEGMPKFGFGQSRATVVSALEEQFRALSYVGAPNWDDVSIVEDSSGDYIRTRSNVGDNSKKQWNVPVPVTKESYLVYRFMLEPGFDAGDGNGDQGMSVSNTGIKMPGLARGHPANNTGGNHAAGGFTGRLMIRGTCKSSGTNKSPRDGIALAAYIYGQQIGGESINSGWGQDYYLLDGFASTPFSGLGNGFDGGCGDPRIWNLPTGKWVTVVLGYRVDSTNGWFKAWTMVDGGSLRERLFVQNIDWMGPGEQGVDSMMWQQFWGGSGSAWYPDSVSYMRFKDFGVFRTVGEAIAAARGDFTTTTNLLVAGN